MELNVTSAALEISGEICRSENSFGAESDLIVPDNMPDILSILQISANAATSACDPQTDRVLLTGNVFFNILYVADTPKREVRAINTGAVFSNIFSAPGVRDSMPVQSEVAVSSISYDLTNCRKLSVHGELTGRIAVYSNTELSLPPTVEGAETQTAQIVCPVIKARGSAQETVTDSFELPAEKRAAEILRDEVKVTDRAVKIIRNKAVVKGTLGVTVLYCGEAGIQQFKGEIPFTKVVNVDGLEEDMSVDCAIDVQGWETELSVGENGETKGIDVETMLYFNVLGRRNQSCCAITDAYYPGGQLICEKQTVSLSAAPEGETEECAVKGSIRLPASVGEIELVYDISGSPRINRVYRDDGNIVAEGSAAVSVLYRTANPEFPTASHSAQLEFRHIFSGEKYDSIPQVTARLRDMSCSLSGGNSIEVRGIAVLSVRPVGSRELTLVTSVRLEEEPPRDVPSILISYITGEKSLWEIAKSYNISREKLMSANDIKSEEELKGRRALVVPR